MDTISPHGRRCSTPVSPTSMPSAVMQEQEDYFHGFEGQANKEPEQEEQQQQQPATSDSSDTRRRPPLLHLNTYPAATNHASAAPRPHRHSSANHMPVISSLDPRPLEELHNERSYLLFNLQRQEQRATRLFQKFAALEQRLPEAHSTKEARKIKKEAAVLKSKIGDNTQQEQLILLRLGEIYVEMQNRERWVQVRGQQQQQQHILPLSATGMAGAVQFPPFTHGAAGGGHGGGLSIQGTTYPTTPSSSLSIECVPASAALSPLSPCFVPSGGVQFSENIWGRASSTDQGQQQDVEMEMEEEEPPSAIVVQQKRVGENGDYFNAKSARGTEEETREDTDMQTNGDADWSSEVDSEQGDAGVWAANARSSFAVQTPYSTKARDKRMSLPCLRSAFLTPTP
ncbi:hypothetical protein B0T19DRAFT_222931 [Cercophora scortea]|uniref:Uncharacterized protein n=1 Tax=Cercophora scortea TaxID=314031 RepID=A0AAE0M9Q9_9PEZI|nr:hypothetical protein B0T19DRAFT_222931 [Cercophora scortea]